MPSNVLMGLNTR